MIVLAKTDKVFGLIRSGKNMTRCDVGMRLVWIGGIIICHFFRMNPCDLSRSVCIPTKTLLQSCICIYPIISKAFSRLLYSIIMSYYVILCHIMSYYVILSFYLPLSQGVDGIHGAVLATVLKAAPWGVLTKYWEVKEMMYYSRSY